MSGNTSNVRVWTGADLLVGDTTATAPTDIATAWGADWDPVGLLSEDGITEDHTDEQKDHFAYGGILVRTTKQKHVRTLKFLALENTLLLAELIEPNSTWSVSGGVLSQVVGPPTAVSNIKSWGLEVRDAAITERLYIPRGEISNVGPRVYSDSEMAQRELTIKIYAASVFSRSDVLYKRLSNDPASQLVDSQ